MIIFKSPDDISNYLPKLQKKTGFVPTMGALHEGHLSLIRTSKTLADVTVCSIFVNPSQFNNKDDFKYYPVSIESDLKLLEAAGCDVLFYPSVDEIYPPSYVPPHYDLGSLEQVLEGEYRPGHFQGVCQVMERLLTIVDPDVLVMGQKDFQQCMVVKRLLVLLNRTNKTEFIIEPTHREADGLAMSSRNRRLTPSERKLAPLIFSELKKMAATLDGNDFRAAEAGGKAFLEAEGFKVDYVAIAKQKDLMPATDMSTDNVILAAAFDGNVRLIDNLVLTPMA